MPRKLFCGNFYFLKVFVVVGIEEHPSGKLQKIYVTNTAGQFQNSSIFSLIRKEIIEKRSRISALFFKILSILTTEIVFLQYSRNCGSNRVNPTLDILNETY